MPTLANNFTYPTLKTLKKQALFLSKNLPVTHCQAQEMIAYDYNCKSWHYLKECTYSPSYYNGHTIRLDRVEIEDMRAELASLPSSEWDECVSKLHRLTLIPYTISHSIAQRRLEWLLDDEIFSLYETVYEGANTPNNSLHKAVRSKDNNILTHIQKLRTLKRDVYNLWIDDHRYGISYYLYIYLKGSQVKLHIRELDTRYTGRDRHAKYNIQSGSFTNIFSTHWFSGYIEGFVNNLVSALTSSGLHGSLTLNNVNDVNTVNFHSRDYAPDGYNFSGMDQLIRNLRQRGATVDNSAGNDRPGLSLNF